MGEVHGRRRKTSMQVQEQPRVLLKPPAAPPPPTRAHGPRTAARRCRAPAESGPANLPVRRQTRRVGGAQRPGGDRPFPCGGRQPAPRAGRALSPPPQQQQQQQQDSERPPWVGRGVGIPVRLAPRAGQGAHLAPAHCPSPTRVQRPAGPRRTRSPLAPAWQSDRDDDAVAEEGRREDEPTRRALFALLPSAPQAVSVSGRPARYSPRCRGGEDEPTRRALFGERRPRRKLWSRIGCLPSRVAPSAR